jgi:hypothetical protein
MQIWNDTRETSSGKTGPETRLSEDHGEYGRTIKEYRHSTKAEQEERTYVADGHYISGISATLLGA